MPEALARAMAPAALALLARTQRGVLGLTGASGGVAVGASGAVLVARSIVVWYE